ncbi:uncharacterized protein TRAVEDRAFT_72065 [Trametes versicolor FP-101664 SS1]|uniref:uncharacterized protein n=1 Tax=Trametes versicolor (strain FP-101664) TaxID=717944 RepID=UPI0004621C10|nr:uncharacterized protein TRAVEDRAFT_72065 [Trametes versicolor FP-101664 SS1]EIW58520.1 hypothetical protein TRAVEDRAFT_72065 [Trametes versicolor FP-101664 SS1]
MSTPTISEESHSEPSHLPLVKPLIYGSRISLLAARVLDNDSSTSTNSTTLADVPSGSRGRPSVNPAIPALIAVVVFVVCTLVVLKGVRALRGDGVVPVYRKPARELQEEKPRMWEVHMDQSPSFSCVRVGEHGWNGMMPISLEYLPPNAPPCEALASASPTRPPLRSSPRASRSLSRDSARSSWSTFSEKPTASVRSAEATEDPARLRVAVLIAMPSPTKPSPSSAIPATPAPAYLGLAEV